MAKMLALSFVLMATLNGLCEGNPVAKLQCEKVNEPVCSSFGYSTSFPNALGHFSQATAGLGISQYLPLIQAGCGGNSFKAFICSAYFPKCDQQQSYFPCRSLCETSKKQCSGLLAKNGFSWPSVLDCSRFPKGGKSKCISNITELAAQPTKVPLVCGGKLTNSNGTIKSPNYPDQYPPKMNCRWDIQLPSHYNTIEITIENLELEEDRNCYYDYVKIVDKLANQVGRRHCGKYVRPYVISVRGNEASIVFASDNNTSKMGFFISYKGSAW